MNEDALPPDSRITSEARDDALIIHLHGRGRQWAIVAAAGFLGITFFVQAVLRGGYANLFLGFGLMLFALGRLNGNLRKIWRITDVRITADELTISPNVWQKSEVSDIRAQRISRRRGGVLLIELRDGTKFALLEGFNPREIEWVASQIKHRWAMPPTAAQNASAEDTASRQSPLNP